MKKNQSIVEMATPRTINTKLHSHLLPLDHDDARHGADVNAEDVQHKTALHYAVQEHRLDTTKVTTMKNKLTKNGPKTWGSLKHSSKTIENVNARPLP